MMTPLSGSFQICYIQSPVNYISTIFKKLHVASSTRHSRPRSCFLKPVQIFALLASKCLIFSATRLRWFAVTSSSSSFFFLSLHYVLQKLCWKHLLRPSVWVQLPVHRVTKLSHKQIGEQIVNHSEGSAKYSLLIEKLLSTAVQKTWLIFDGQSLQWCMLILEV